MKQALYGFLKFGDLSSMTNSIGDFVGELSEA